MSRSILYIDPDKDDQQQFRKAVGQVKELTVTVVADTETALDLIDDRDFDIIVSVVGLDDGDVTDLFERAREREKAVPCIIFTDRDFEGLLDEELLLSASAFTSKEREEAFKHLVEEIQGSLRPRSEIEYPVPEDEEGRLKAANAVDLERLRDADTFDRLTKIAKAFFDVRYAFVGILKEDSEQFISFAGDDMEMLARECSICTFGILDDDAIVVDNRHQDARFKYIEELEDLDIVFYTGYPLVTGDGYRIGMFCIMDDEPRDLSAEDRRFLKLFADEAAELIRLYDGDA